MSRTRLFDVLDDDMNPIAYVEGTPGEEGGLVYSSRGTLLFGAFKTDVIVPEVHEKLGVAYKRLPAVKMDDLTIETGETQKRHWRHGGGWYYHTKYGYQGKTLGTVQESCDRFGRRNTLTCFENSCVVGRNVRWLLKENGLRLVD